MKVFLCILGVVLVAAVCVNCEMNPKMKQVFEECRAEAGMPNEKPKGRPNMDDPQVKCFHACTMKKMGKMVNGKLVVDKVVQSFTKRMPAADDDIKERIEECAYTANEEHDECEVSAALHRCIKEKVRFNREQ